LITLQLYAVTVFALQLFNNLISARQSHRLHKNEQLTIHFLKSVDNPQFNL
jgi:hypothetical protein